MRAAGDAMRGKNNTADERARSLRQLQTKPEFLLWRRLRNRGLDAFKFVRQEPIGPFYADFVCRERRVIAEVDGGQHSDSESDARRDKYLAALGYRVIRVWNNEVLGNLDGVAILTAFWKCSSANCGNSPKEELPAEHAIERCDRVVGA